MLPCAAHHSALALAVTMLTAGYELGHLTSLMGGGMQVLTTAPSSPLPHRYEFGQVTSLAGPDGRYGTQLLMLSASLIAPDDVTDCT